MKINKTNKLKTNTSGFGHLEMLLLVVAVVVIAGVGFFVYQNHNKKTTKAHAGSWASYQVNSQVCASWDSKNCPGGDGGYTGRINATLWACRQYINAYGGVNQVHAHFMSGPFYYNSYYQGTYRGPYAVIPDNTPRQNGTVWHPFGQNGRDYYNGDNFVMNFPAWQVHNFYAVLNDGSQQVKINVNNLPQC